MSAKIEQLDLALVGYEPEGSENLSLRLLAGAAEDAGRSVELFFASGIRDAQEVTRRAARANSRVIGFTAPDTETAVHSLALAQLSRRAGYRGYIVCGGPFATLQPEWILERASAVDGVIRFDGETPLVELLRALREGAGVEAVPSLTTRERSNPPLGSDNLVRWRPQRGELPQVMGLPTAMLIGGRGCSHSCDYCTHAAQASLVLRECREAGVPAEELRRSGLGRPRRRSLDDLVGELAELYHDRGVRYFQFVDENLVPSDEAQALELIAELRRRFDTQRIGAIALSLMTRGDALTEPVVDALVELGLVRTLVGVESGSNGSLASLGRSGDAARGRRGARLLVERGVVAMFNSLMLHPASTADSVRRELEFLGSMRGVQFETIQVVPFPRTRLNRRLSRQDRLSGGRLLPGFTFEDPAIERFHGLLARLQTRVLRRYTPAFRVHDLLLSATLAERFGRGRRPGAVLRRLRELTGQINRARLDALTDLLHAAEAGRSADLDIQRAVARFEPIRRELDRCQGLLESGRGLAVSRQYRNLAAAAAFVFALASAPACHHVGAPLDQEAPGDHGEPEDSGTSVVYDEDSGDGDDATLIDEICGDEEYWADYNELVGLCHDNCDLEEYQATVKIVLDADGAVTGVEVHDGWSEEPNWQEELTLCYQDLLDGEEFPCLAGEEIWIYGAIGGIE